MKLTDRGRGRASLCGEKGGRVRGAGQDGDDNNDNIDPASTIPEECKMSLHLLETSRSAWRQF